MTQTVVEGKSPGELDLKRTSVFIVFGAAYLGVFQWWIQVPILLSLSPVCVCVCVSLPLSVCLQACLFVMQPGGQVP